jgi:hypothetical protein
MFGSEVRPAQVYAPLHVWQCSDTDDAVEMFTEIPAAQVDTGEKRNRERDVAIS